MLLCLFQIRRGHLPYAHSSAHSPSLHLMISVFLLTLQCIFGSGLCFCNSLQFFQLLLSWIPFIFFSHYFSQASSSTLSFSPTLYLSLLLYTGVFRYRLCNLGHLLCAQALSLCMVHCVLLILTHLGLTLSECSLLYVATMSNSPAEKQQFCS